MKTQGYTVEAHGVQLVVHGDRGRLSRVGAWESVKALSAVGSAHTIKVLRGGAVVFRALRQADGSYINAETCETIAA